MPPPPCGHVRKAACRLFVGSEIGLMSTYRSRGIEKKVQVSLTSEPPRINRFRPAWPVAIYGEERKEVFLSSVPTSK